jgi:hypothetical protein
MIKRAFDALEKGAFLNEFVPIPKSLHIVAGRVGDSQEDEALEAQEKLNEAQHGYKNWYDFCSNEWGTKWDVGDEGSQTLVNENELTTYFDSAWSPPTGAYAKLQDLGFEVEAYYYEPGMCFAGIYDENGDECYDINGTSEWVRENIPKVLDEMFGISENMSEWEEENAEE